MRALLIAATLLFLTIPSRFGATGVSYTLATLLMFGAHIALTAMFRTNDLDESETRVHRTAPLIAATIAAVLLVIAARAWLYEILVYPHDPLRADMLIVIQEGIRRMLRGQNPYTMYHVPWDATLPYGPVLWLPYAVPYMMRADVRLVALLGELFVPVACALTAMACASRGRYGAAIASLVLLAAAAASRDLREFSSIAHTPSYWPGIALLAWLVARERWLAAATACGLLIVARTTMIAVAPVLLMAVWQYDRRRAPRALVALTLATLLPYLPFALWDPAALKYALYGSYQLLMKGFVWTSTTWAHNTIGVTGLLLRNGASLTRAERVRLSEILAANRHLWVVYVLKDALKALWRYTYVGAARRAWAEWYGWAVRSRIHQLAAFARHLKAKVPGILAHCRHPLHTSVLEGINNKIKVLKRVAYGYRDEAYFFLKIRAAFPGNP